jgi:hypothetical protein
MANSQNLGTGRRLALKGALLAGLAATLAAGAAPAAAEVAVLQGLDKVTARISTFYAPAGTPVTFGSLEITARSCQKTPPEETPESAAFLEIIDVRPDSESVALFKGWMYASSPAVSAMEHPVYDVWVVDCKSDEEYKADLAKEAQEDGEGEAKPAE